MKNNEKDSVMIKAFDKADRVISKGVLLASMPILYPADVVVTSILQHKNPLTAMKQINNEVRKRLNKGEGRGRHLLGANL